VITIGIRAAPKAVTFAIYDASAKAVVNVENINVPAAFHWPESLKYVRSNLLDVLREYLVERAGIRLAEAMARSISYDRIHIEGVIQEAFASSDLRGYLAGPIATIASRVKVERDAVKRMVAGHNQLEIEGWADFDENEREAVLAAIGAGNV
jgi:hypothetical protein